jgi:putative transposase
MLLPNNWQRTRLFQYAGVARFAYNWALNREMESLSSGNGFISDSDLRKEFTQLKKLPEYSWINGVAVDVSKQAIKDLVSSYMNYFRKRKAPEYKPYTKKQIDHAKRVGKTLTEYDKQGHPKFKSKKRFSDYGFFNASDRTIFSDDRVEVSALCNSGNRVRRNKKRSIKLSECCKIDSTAKLYNIRITFDGLHWWVSASFEESEICRNSVCDNVGFGIDLGIKDTAIFSDGTSVRNINKSKQMKLLEKRKRRLQHKVSRQYIMNKKGESYQKTKNIRKSELRLLKLNRRLTNIRHNHIHQMTSSIVKREPSFIVIEDLNVSGMMKNKHISKAVQQQCFYEIRRQLTYKTVSNGIKLIVADRWYPSSKLCNCCGKIKKDLKLSDRIYKCECGYVSDRDVNAARNLYTYGLNFI